MDQVQQDNLAYLTNTALPKLGFDQVMDQEVKRQLQIDQPQFSIPVTAQFGKDQMEYVVIFEKSTKDLTDPRFFVNAIDATLTKDGHNMGSHHFQLYNQSGHNATAMYNMMDGRYAIREWRGKDGTDKQQSVTIDLSKKDDDGNTLEKKRYTEFNIVAQLSKVPIMVSQTDKDILIQNVKLGSAAETFIRNNYGQKEKVVLVANPIVGNIAVYNMDGKRIELESKMKMVVSNPGAPAMSVGEPKLPDATKELMAKGLKEELEGKQQNQGPKKKAV